MKSMTKTTSILLILTLAVAVQPLLAQSGRGTLTGVVKDALGALNRERYPNKANGTEVSNDSFHRRLRAPILSLNLSGNRHSEGFKAAVRTISQYS